MSYKKIFSYVILSIIFSFAGFGVGFFIGNNSISSQAVQDSKQKTLPSLESYNPQTVEENSLDNSSELTVKYLLKDENGTLTLYRVSDEITSIIKSVSFNSSILPSDDRIKLQKGIYLDSIEQGFQLIEDFTS